ncbi:MAG: hypothetical protein ASARMPREDX12_000332 [Alectoria sarmentosa]|nr:MAG: hypothetical protein ASARMPREDX12_000332 [Alectoria sarmentosa]
MAPKKRPAKKSEGGSTSANKPAQRKSTKTEKKSSSVAKKPPPKESVGKTAAIKKETKKKSIKVTGKAAAVIKVEEISDKPAGNTRAATKKEPKDKPTKSAGKPVAATTKKPKRKPPKPAGKTSAAAKEPSSELVGFPSEDKPAASPNRKRKTEDKWTETTDLPVPKSPKLNPGSSPNPSRKSREIRTLEEFASEGWDTKDFNRELCCIDTVDLSRIPSPFANLADRAESFMHIIDNHTHPRVWRLFRTIYGADTASLMSRLDGGSPGAFVALQHDMTLDQFFLVGSDKPEFSLELTRGDGTKAGASFDVHIRKNYKTDEVDYFVANEKLNLLIINEKHIGRKLAAGPLPDFAVILINRSVIFWWRTRAAMDYIPEPISHGVKEVKKVGATEEQPLFPPSAKKGGTTAKEPSPPKKTAKKGDDTAKEPSSPLPSGIEEGETAKEPTTSPKYAKQDEDDITEPVAPRLTWKKIMNDGLARHSSKQDASMNGSELHEIKSASGMTIDDVLFAVGTIWEGLRIQGVPFAYADTNVFDPAYQQMVGREGWQTFGVVGKGDRFIMPLWFPPNAEEIEKGHKKNLDKKKTGARAKGKEDQAKASTNQPSSDLGHLLLAVAEKHSSKAKTVHIEIRDSLNEFQDPHEIRDRARELAETWLGGAVEISFTDIAVPRQTGNSNACGFHVILNAWAVMLGIPLHQNECRRKSCGHHKTFIKIGLKIVNLALAGFMDSRTIQAFMNVFGVSEEQDSGTAEDPAKPRVDAVKMDGNRLRRALERQQNNIEMPSPSSSSQSSAHSPGSTDLKKAVFESKVQQFIMALGSRVTRGLAQDFIAMAGGDINEAITAFVAHT